MLRYYETVFVLHPETEEEKKAKLLESLKKVVKKFKGEITHVDEWGKKRLAYPIMKLKEGYYVLINYRLFPEDLKEIKHRLKLNEQVIRFQTVKLDEKIVEQGSKGVEKSEGEKMIVKENKEGTH